MADLHMVRHNARRDSAQCRNPRWRHTHSIRYFLGILTRTPRLVPEGIVAMTNPLGCPAQRVLSIHTSQQKLLQPLQQALLRCVRISWDARAQSRISVSEVWARWKTIEQSKHQAKHWLFASTNIQQMLFWAVFQMRRCRSCMGSRVWGCCSSCSPFPIH